MDNLSTAAQANETLKGSPYFAREGSRGVKFYKRYNFTTTDEGYKVSKPEVVRWLERVR